MATGGPEAEGEAPPPEAAPPANPGDSVAPDRHAQPDLVLRKIQDLLKDDTKARALEKETGMSRDELEQFVKKFDKAPQADPGAPRDLTATPGKDKTLDPNRKIADSLAGSTVSGRNQRGAGVVPQDTTGGNVEGARTVAPVEFRSRFEAYQNSLNHSTPAKKK
jgi:hypothetical protein